MVSPIKSSLMELPNIGSTGRSTCGSAPVSQAVSADASLTARPLGALKTACVFESES